MNLAYGLYINKSLNKQNNKYKTNNAMNENISWH